jgi:ATP-dependent Clp protease ATP-binding subunit ClpA
LESLVRFAVISAGRLHASGLPQSALDEMTSDALAALGGLPPAGQARILPALVRRSVTAWTSGRKWATGAAAEFAAQTAGLTETLSGLSQQPRAARTPQVQQRITETLTDPSLLAYFQEHLLAQETALLALVDRLAGEALTRPPHQPIRYCALGTPGTGKSESAALLARRLGVPFINIDAASMSDYHTAAAQLLGSGRGIVGSHQSGRLEQAAKHHTGVVVEVSDIDHAVPSVQSYMADLFLQVLDMGEAQSSIGPKFSCANLLFAFTMNLPAGLDERIRQSMGFSRTPSRQEVTAGVAAEVKSMLSGAFLSRIGTPVVFDPLEGPALAKIVARAVENAVRSAAERLGFTVVEVAVSPATGEAALTRLRSKLVSFGARALLEHARDLSAKAVLEWMRSAPAARSVKLGVAVDAGGDLIVTSI